MARLNDDDKRRLDSAGIKGGQIDEYKAIWSSHDTGYGRSDGPESLDPGTIRELNSLKGTIVTSADQSSLDIWRGAESSTYNNTYAQTTLQKLEALDRKKDQFIFADIETLGTFRPDKKAGDALDFYMPTEISMMHMDVSRKRSNVTNGVRLNNKYGGHNVLPMVLKPTSEAYSKLDSLVKKLETNTNGINVNLSRDERRTLQDLILYSNEGHFNPTEIAGRKVTTIMKQARDQQLMGAASLIGKGTVSKIRAGLDNLTRLGTDPSTAIELMNEFMHDIGTAYGGTTHLVGHNFQRFDRPAILDFIEGSLVAKHNPNSKITKALDVIRNTPFIDTLQVENTLRRNPGTLYDNMQLSHLAEVKGLMKRPGLFINPNDPAAAHFSAFDIEINGRVFANQLTEYNRIKNGKMGRSEMMRDIRYASWDNTQLKANDLLFAHSGVSGFRAGKYDSVFTLGRNGKLELANTMKGANPLYRNNTYQLLQTGTRDIGGQSMFTATLHNTNRNTYHFFARDTLEEIQNLFHQNMAVVRGDEGYLDTLSKESRLDAATRRWNKMFSNEAGGGVNLTNRMLSALKVYDEKSGLVGQQVGKRIFTQADLDEHVKQAGGFRYNRKWKAASEGFLSDFNLIKDRLRAEAPMIQEMLGAMNANSNLAKDTQAQSIALGRFRQNMDSAFGRNTKSHDPHSPMRSVLQFDLGDGNPHNVVVSDNLDTVQSSISRMLTAGHDRDAVSPVFMKTRLEQVINALRAEGADVITANQAKDMLNRVRNLGSDQSSWYIIRDISFRLNQARQRAVEKGMRFGLSTINIEDPTQLVMSRANAMHDPDKGWSKRNVEIVKDAVDHGSTFATKAKNGLNVAKGSVIENILNQHDNAVKAILEKSSVGTTRIANPTSIRETMEKMLQSYVKQGMEATLFYGGEKRGLMMALYHKDQAASIRGKSAQEIFAMNNVARVDLPLLTSAQNLRVGKTERVGRLKAMRRADGTMQYVTGVEEVLEKVGLMSRTAANMVAQGRAGQVEGFLNGVIRNTVSNLSMNASKQNIGDARYNFEVRKSRAANWARGGMIDVSDFAQEWFTERYGSDRTGEVLGLMQKDRSLNFVGAMGNLWMRNDKGRREDAKLRFQREAESWIQERYGLTVNSHSAKDTYVSQYVRSARDIREMYAFGQFNAMARENIMKSVNYMPMDRGEVENALSYNGFSRKDVARMTKRGLVTDTALKELGDEMNFLSVRSAYMSSKDVFDRFGDAALSTHEGMFVLRDDVAKAYKVNNRKDIRLSSGARLDRRIEDALKDMFGEFDYGTSYSLDPRAQGTNLINLMGGRINDASPQQGKVTVGGLMKNDQFRATDYYGDIANDVYIRGWDAENRALVLDKMEALQDGDKMLTTEGHRITVSIRSKEAFEKAGLGSVEAILPQVNPKRREYGMQMDRAVQLAYDEMRRAVDEGREVAHLNNGKISVGKIALEQGLETLREVMNRHLGTEGAVRIEGDQLVLDSKFGIGATESRSMKDVYRFLRTTGKALGTDFVGGDYMVGQTGLALADVHRWENSIGPVEGNKAGLVRWGIKEMDMIQERVGRDTDVGKWLQGHMNDVISSQHQDAQRMSKALTRTITSYGSFKGADGSVRAGDVIIRTNATKGEFGLDNESGRRRGFIDTNGAVNVSMEAFDDVPMRSKKGENLTVGDYQRTMLQMHTVDLDIHGDGKSMSFKQALDANNRTVLFELPEGMSHKYVRMIDDNMASVGDMPVVRDLQRIQSQIWSLTKDYNAAGPEVDVANTKERLQGAIDQYHEKVAHLTSSAREGSLAKTLMAGKMDMSGRFKIQGINPTAAATKGYQDATAYISRNRMAEMIAGEGDAASRRGNYQRVAETLFAGDQKALGQLTGMADDVFEKTVLDKISKDGLYGFVGRYPTIAKDTIQVMKLAIDDSLVHDANYRPAMMTVGTAYKLKADFDGDFLSTVLAQYKIGDADQRLAVHNQMGQIWDQDSKTIREFYDKTLLPEIDAEANRRSVTVQQLMRDDNFRAAMGGEWKVQTGGIFDVESAEARIGKQLIGYVDNTRFKLLNIAGATHDILGNASAFGERTAQELAERRGHIEEFGRIFSQDLISSKKFDVEEIRRGLVKDGRQGADSEIFSVIERRREALAVMTEGISNPNKAGVQMILEANKDLKLFDNDPKINQKYSLDTMLRTLTETYQLNGENEKWLSNKYLQMGVSEGNNIEVLSQVMNAKGHMAVKTDWLQNYMDSLGDDGEAGEIKARLNSALQRHDQLVMSRLDRMKGGTMNFGADTVRLGEEMLGHTAAEGVGMQMKNFAGQVFGGLAPGQGMLSRKTLGVAGAIFGGIWAANTLSGGGVTPEGNTAQQEGRGAPVPKSMMSGPTARIEHNPSNEDVTIRIAGKDASNMSADQISALVHGELNSMMPMSLNMNLNVNDNSQNIDRDWLQGVMANALNFGTAF